MICLTDVSGALRLGRSGVHTRTWESRLLVDLGELTPCEPPPFNVSLGYLPRPQVPAIEPFGDRGTRARRGRAPGNAAGAGTAHVRARREPGAQRPGRGSHPAVPRAGRHSPVPRARR